MSAITDVLSAFGVTGEIAVSVASAIADPTSANLQAVVDAYLANGQVVPGKLMAYLVQQNEAIHPEDTYRGIAFPWLFAGAALAVFLIFRKRR
jgi:hypothetical protein